MPPRPAALLSLLFSLALVHCSAHDAPASGDASTAPSTSALGGGEVATATCDGGFGGAIHRPVAAPCDHHGADECLADSDCIGGSVCTCASPYGASSIANQCVTAACRTDADCLNGLGCSFSRSSGAGAGMVGVEGWHCRTPEDSCASDCQCAPGACSFDSSRGSWSCVVGFAG